ncbi:chymotrypsin-1-like [Anopheles aquasalis]|uniref:chymotrypsin-1-like n=1 Tax=Anopheles aquasalis TaxID=42839 RepID=UPI00215B1AE4|nr:chymotrypsin-1-like [Anopheles aquasalis]
MAPVRAALVGFFLITVAGMTRAEVDPSAPQSDDSKIVGGSKAEERIPYQISLQVLMSTWFGFGPRRWMHNCGGSIVNEFYIVTAAHCLDGMNTSRMSVVAGTNDLRNDGAKGTRYYIASYLIHPDYIELNRSDIGVMRTTQRIQFTDNVQPITYSSTFVGGGETCLLTGWGYTMPVRIGSTPEDLQEAELTTITNDECREKGMPVNPTEICTFTRRGQGACGGDSGGPLVCNKQLSGVVSYGTRFCGIGVPDVYTRVSEFDSWIQENTMVSQGDEGGAGN